MNHFLARAFAILTLLSLDLLAANENKPTVPIEDYGRFELLWRGSRTLSRDGAWLAYDIERVDEKNELRVCHTREDQTHILPLGKDPVFSADSAWLKWTVTLSEAEREKLVSDKKVRALSGLLDLKTGTQRIFKDVASVAFDESGRFIALLGHAPDDTKTRGGDLSILDLRNGGETVFGNVAHFSWSQSGSMIAMILKTESGRANGVTVFDGTDGRLQTLDTSAADYRYLIWRKDHPDLAVFRSRLSAETLRKDKEKHPAWRLLAWRGLDKKKPGRLELDPGSAGVAETLRVVGHARPGWSPDGRLLSFGLRPVKPEPEAAQGNGSTGPDSESASTPEKAKPADVQIWHSKDVRIIPEQVFHEKQDRERVLTAVWHLDENRVVQIGSDLLAKTEILKNWRYATERTTARYPWGEKFGRWFEDVWVIDIHGGTRKKVFEKVRYSWNGPSGKRLLRFDGAHYHAYDLESGRTLSLTRDLETSFAMTDYDVPTDVLPPHGVGGWLPGDTAVLLYDKHNVWRVPLDGSKALRLTDGDSERVVHRVLDLDKEADSINPEQDLYFSLWGEWSEKRGFARLRAGRKKARTLIYVDGNPTRLMKAAEADTFIYTTESAIQSPEIIRADGDLKPDRTLDKLNPFQKKYAWTRSELINFRSEDGVDLQAGLLYPAGYQPGRRYPMIVFTYEKLSSWLHRYRVPDHRNIYSFAVWNQNGYAVLLPDIVYQARNPGSSAIAAVRPAIRKVVEMGLADETKIGLAGHSWGGYQSAFLATRTRLFAAVVSGAPVTDFVSFMGQIHWHPGIAETSHWETGQNRMEVPYWEDVEAHLRNSPLHKVHESETPILMAHGDKDMTVEFFQSTVFYNYARRAEKDMVLLVYKGESHEITKKENRIDFHRRILEWFDHYLKGEPAPTWITEGIPLEGLDREKRRIIDQLSPGGEGEKHRNGSR